MLTLYALYYRATLESRARRKLGRPVTVQFEYHVLEDVARALMLDVPILLAAYFITHWVLR